MISHVKNLLQSTKARRLQANKHLLKIKRVECITSVIAEVSSAVTVSSIVITLSAANPVSLLIGAVFSTISALISAARKAYDIQHKLDSLTNTVNDLHAIEREIRLLLTLHIPDGDYERIVSDFNERITLIESHSVPMHIEHVTDSEDISKSVSETGKSQA